MPVSLRSLYNYIDAGKLTIRNIDLRRKTGYKQRKSGKKGTSKGFASRKYRIGRTYENFEKDVKYTTISVTEMDTVIGARARGKRLLTMIFRDNSIMLMFLMPDGKAESVKRVFDYLERGLGLERFVRLFDIILTDYAEEKTMPKFSFVA